MSKLYMMQLYTLVGARDFLFLIPVWTSPGTHTALFTVGNGPLSWDHSSWGMEPFTHPNVVLILGISRALPPLPLCATIGMLLSDRFLMHMCGLLFMNWVFWIRTKEKQQTWKAWYIRNVQRKFASPYPAMCIDTGKQQKGHNSLSCSKTSPCCFLVVK